MGKGFVFVVVFSIFTLVLFGVLVFLMQSINPPPVVVHDDNNGDDTTDNENNDDHNKTRRSGDHDYFYSDEYEFKTYRGLEKAKKINDPIIVTEPMDTTIKPESTTDVDVTKGESISSTNVKNKNRLKSRAVNDTFGTAFSVKGHRRSADNNNKIERNIYVPTSGTLVLKILDDQGDTRVEIKLNPIPMKKNHLYIKKLNSSSLDTENDYYNSIIYDEGTNFINESKIIIMPNNTVIYNDNGSNKSDETHFTVREKVNETLLKFNSNNITDNSVLKYKNVIKNVTEKIQTIKFKNTTKKYNEDFVKKSNDTIAKIYTTQSNTNNTDMLPLKVVFNNETKLFTTTYKLIAGVTELYQDSMSTSSNSTKTRH